MGAEALAGREHTGPGETGHAHTADRGRGPPGG